MINVPKDVKRYLVKHEKIDEHLCLKDTDVFTTSHKMFIKKGDTVRKINFAHISRIESFVTRNWLIISIGIVVIVGTFFLRAFEPPSWASSYPWTRLLYGYGDSDGGGWTYYILGLVLITLGIISKTPRVKLCVEDPFDELVFSGHKPTLDKLFQLVNERSVQVKTK